MINSIDEVDWGTCAVGVRLAGEPVKQDWA